MYSPSTGMYSPSTHSNTNLKSKGPHLHHSNRYHHNLWIPMEAPKQVGIRWIYWWNQMTQGQNKNMRVCYAHNLLDEMSERDVLSISNPTPNFLFFIPNPMTHILPL
ncbi:hypothetical protein L1887_42924 [Cichorium endivia]|nr:hypothetical protein L1887_42924 [Cichorium endivia]